MSKASQSGAVTQHVSWHQHVIQYFLSHFLACRKSFNNLAITPLSTLITITAIGICLSLPMGLYLFIKNIQHLSAGWDQGSAITLYVNPQSTTQQLHSIVDKIKTYPFVERINILGPDKALEEFQKLSGINDVLHLLPENPLPAVISVKIDTSRSTQSDLLEMKEALSHLPLVKKVDVDYEWVEKLNVFLSFGRTLINFLYCIIGIGVTLIVGNTVRLALESHREEITVLNLIGATNAFIRRPFLYRGMLYGMLGGIISALIISLALFALKGPAQELSSLYYGLFSLEKLHFYDTVWLLAAGCALGWLGAIIAFTQQNLATNCEG